MHKDAVTTEYLNMATILLKKRKKKTYYIKVTKKS